MPSTTTASFNLLRFLEYKIPTVFERQERELVFDNGMLLPQSGDLPFGATDVVAELVDRRGEAKIIASGDNDIPLVDVKVTEDKYPVVRLAAGFRYEESELEAATFAESNGQIITNLKDRRMIAARRVIDEKSHILGAFGDVPHNMYGLLNNPNVPVLNLSTGPHSNGYTADQMIQFVTTSYDTIVTNTLLVAKPDIILLPYRTYSLLNTTYRSSPSDLTVLQHILNILTPLGLRAIKPVNELTSEQLVKYGAQASGTNKYRMVLYKLDPFFGFNRQFTPYKQSIPEYRKMGYETYMIKSVSSVLNEYPNNALYVDYPTGL